jgi:hypothetical protein
VRRLLEDHRRHPRPYRDRQDPRASRLTHPSTAPLTGGELEQFKRRHAEYYRDLFERAEAEWETRPTAEWLLAYGREIDNVRAALD